MSQVQPTVARSFLRQLSGFRGYPRDADGEGRFVEVLCEVSLSVEHAMAIIWAFEENFPTIRELRDTAFGLRPKFEAKIDQREQWEKEYGKPDPMWSQRMVNAVSGMASDVKVDPESRKRTFANEKRAMLWQAIRDSIYYTEGPGGGRPDAFWYSAMDKHNRTHPVEVAAFRVQLAESGWDTLMAVDWLKSMPVMARPQRPVPVLANPITQSDIDRELERAGREPGDGE